MLSRHPILQLLIYHQSRILTLTQIFQFFILSHNLNIHCRNPRRICRLRTISLYPYPDQLLSFFATPFRPIQSNHPLPSLSTPSYASQVTPTYSPFRSDRSHNNSPDTIQICDYKFPNIQLSSTITSSNPPTPTPSSAYTPSLAQSSTSTETTTSTNRAYRTFKRKFPNHPFPAKPGTVREYINHPEHTNTKNFLAITLP